MLGATEGRRLGQRTVPCPTVPEGVSRLGLNMWEFNEGALAFYEAVGFRTYRRYMQLEP